MSTTDPGTVPPTELPREEPQQPGTVPDQPRPGEPGTPDGPPEREEDNGEEEGQSA